MVFLRSAPLAYVIQTNRFSHDLVAVSHGRRLKRSWPANLLVQTAPSCWLSDQAKIRVSPSRSENQELLNRGRLDARKKEVTS